MCFFVECEFNDILMGMQGLFKKVNIQYFFKTKNNRIVIM